MRSYGKIILIGEHSVVYGKKALALPFTAGYVDTKVKKNNEWFIDSRIYKGPLEEANEALSPIKKLIELLRDDFHLIPLSIEIKSTLPVSAGLGSSAAVATSVTKTIFQHIKKPLPHDVLFEYVQYSERLAHGVSSGLDPLITTTGKPYIFTRNGYRKPLSFSLDAYLVIANSNQIGYTADAVNMVKDSCLHKDGMKHIDQLGELAEMFIRYISLGDVAKVGELMNLSALELNELGIETTLLKEIADDARRNGALGAKLTGSGMGGCVIALANTLEDAKFIEKEWKVKEYQTWIMDMKEVG